MTHWDRWTKLELYIPSGGFGGQKPKHLPAFFTLNVYFWHDQKLIRITRSNYMGWGSLPGCGIVALAPHAACSEPQQRGLASKPHRFLQHTVSIIPTGRCYFQVVLPRNILCLQCNCSVTCILCMKYNRNADRPAFMAADTNFLSRATYVVLTQPFSRTAAITCCFGEGTVVFLFFLCLPWRVSKCQLCRRAEATNAYATDVSVWKGKPFPLLVSFFIFPSDDLIISHSTVCG